MKTKEAIKKYNHAENIIRKVYPGISAIRRAEEIERLLSAMYGDDESDEIIDLVFANEFYPIGLNKNE